MRRTSESKFVIAGAGLAGAVMANYLGKAGYQVELYEKRPDLRTADISAGKSINLALSVRGLHALEEIGVAETVMEQAVPMPGRMMHGLDGSLSYQPYGQKGQAINSVSRGGLNCTLLDALERYPNVRVFFNHRCVDVDLDAPTATFDDGAGGQITAVGDAVIGTDGAFSAVRNRMQRLDRFDYSQTYLQHGYKELCIPPGPNGEFLMEKHALHIWPRKSFMMIALPNADASYTVTCFWPFDGPNGFDAVNTPDAVEKHFRQWFPDAVPLMPNLRQDYFDNPTSSLCTIRCGPWNYKDKVVLMGDAAHAVVPFYGQGMNAAFEDCVELNACLAEFGDDRARAFEAYFERRKENADAIADLAIANFIEMRDKVGDPAFLRKKKRQKLLHKLLPNWYTPPYEMVSFTRIPYAETVRRAEYQDRVIRRVGWSLAAVLAILVVGGAYWALSS
ncbi:MAG TPA: NAD(P)/FAD-dependent oxidoreductase [Phycisphaerae bacterium]|nr:NAD(P)/FAD-dependent oxidoreductase [Phycisphaerae bacterium]HRW56004.1 NAD(P)/FAD-dependent oxidoreductase [Phycisphaerae bacterium]